MILQKSFKYADLMHKKKCLLIIVVENGCSLQLNIFVEIYLIFYFIFRVL